MLSLSGDPFNVSKPKETYYAAFQFTTRIGLNASMLKKHIGLLIQTSIPTLMNPEFEYILQNYILPL